MARLNHVLDRIKIRKPTKRQLVIGAASLLGIIIAVQIFFPADHLLPFARIDNRDVGGWQKKDAAWEINTAIAKTTIPVHRGNEDSIYLRETPATLGISIDSMSAIKSVSYPWYMRLIPSSIVWYGLQEDASDYTYTYDAAKTEAFIKEKLASCKLAPQNASLVYKDTMLELMPSKNGGVCAPKDVTNAVEQLRPTVSAPANLTFPATITPPLITDNDANKVKRYLDEKTGNIAIETGKKTVDLPYDMARSWLVFDNSGKRLSYSFDQKKSDDYLSKVIAPLVTVNPGTTKVTTRDFTEISRTNGTPGQAVNSLSTRQSILDVFQGKAEKATAVTTQVPPKVEYIRTYSSSDVGLSALVQQFTKDNKGTFGVQYIELDGQKRRASYNENKQFITASTYKLFVAYSTLKRVESGQFKWSDQVTGGQNLTTCFDKMIVNSDNACAEALYSKIGYQTVINEARALGLSHTVLDKEAQKTSAGDLAILLGSVYSGTIDLSSSSRDRLISAMKRNVYRQGIPSGSSGTVADKVGFLDGLLHDASIVYSKKGDYVLVIMTDGSSWGKIAELTRKIESIR